MGRKMMYPEKREAAFVEGTIARIQAIIEMSGESVVGYIRSAVEQKLLTDESPDDAAESPK
jgi:hypothetical protein